MILTDAGTVLSSFPGNLVYHLTIAFVLALLFSITQALRTTDLNAESLWGWRAASGGLLALRLLLMAAVALSWIVALDPAILLPPLDRYVSFTSLIVFGWAILRYLDTNRADSSLIILLLAGLLGAVGTAFALAATGAPGPFNRSIADLIWSILSLTASLITVGLLVYRRPLEWHLGVAGFGILATTYLLHLIFGNPDASLAGIVRLGELAAYPIFSVLAIRQILLGMADEEPVLEELPVAAGVINLPPPSPAEVMVYLSSLMAIDDMKTFIDSLVEAIGHSMRTEYSLLLSPPDPAGELTIDTGFDLIRQLHLSGEVLDVEDFPVITAALERRRTMTLPAQSQSPDIRAIKEIMRLDTNACALMVPLVNEDELLGGLLLLSPYARRSWSNRDRDLLQDLASPISHRLYELKYEKPTGKEVSAQDELSDAHLEIASLRDQNDAYRVELESLPSLEVDDESTELTALMLLHEEAQKTIQELEAQVQILESETDSVESLSMNEEIDELAGELQSALAELADARERLRQIEPTSGSNGYPGASPDLDAIASIAQELRQPMSSIMGYTDLLLGESVGLLGAMQRKFLERVRSGIERMGTMVGDLIQLTTIEVGGLNLQPESVDLLTCIEEAVMQSRGLLREKNLALRMDFPDIAPSIAGDEDAVNQILLHLIENAIGASPEGEEVILAVRIQSSEEDEFMMISISDSGDGIPPEDLGRVFQKVYEADNVLIQGLGDHGVGLSLVKALSEAMGGRVWVNSEVGIGSTFTILMPCLTDVEEPLETSEQAA